MSVLKPQVSSIAPAYGVAALPPLQLPQADPRYGMTAQHQQALEQYITALHGALQAQQAANVAAIQSANTQISDLKTQLKNLQK